MIFQVLEDNGKKHEITGVITDSMVQTRVKNADYNLDFTIIKKEDNEKVYELLEVDAMILFEDQKYIVKSCPSNPYSKAVTCVHEFYELIDDYVEGYVEQGVYTPTQLLTLVFSQTPDWGFDLIESDLNNIQIDKFGENNPVSLLQSLMVMLDAEFEPNSVGKRVKIAKRLGTDTNFEIEFKKNLMTVEKSVDSSSVKTAIHVYYDRRETGEYNGSFVYESPNASSYRRLKWEKPLYLDNVNSYSAALEIAKTSINDIPEVSIKTTFATLIDSGYTGKEISIGNSVRLIDNRINEYGKVRIIEVSRFPLLPNYSPEIVLANRPKNMMDSIIKEQENREALDKIVVKQTEVYDGVQINEFGLKVKSRTGLVDIDINGDEGFTIRRGSIRTFYADISGNVVMDGKLRITNGNGYTVLLEAYKDYRGGRLNIHDDIGWLNVSMGSEIAGNGFSGGIVQVFRDGNESVPLAEMSAKAKNSFSNPVGRIILRDYSNDSIVELIANEGVLIRDNSGREGFYSSNFAMIDNSLVATQEWVTQNFQAKE